MFMMGSGAVARQSMIVPGRGVLDTVIPF